MDASIICALAIEIPPGATMRGRKAPLRQAGAFVLETMESRRMLSASISGTAFVDTNLDGIRQSTDVGLAGEKVYVDANTNGKFDAGEKFATSNASGSYSLTNLAAGSYRLLAVPPAGYRYDWTGPAGYVYNVTVTSSSVVTGKNFGNTTKSIIGKVYNDTNATGSSAAGNAGLSGFTVWLDSNKNGILNAGEKTAISNSAGMFAFDNLPVGDYQIRQVPKSGWRITQIVGGAYTFHLGTDHVFRGDYGNTTHPLLSGYVFRDLDGNGIKDAGESPLAGVRVFIDKDADGIFDAGETSVLTSASGFYSFRTLIAGTYSVRVVTPSGMHTTKPTGGVFSITLASGQTVQNKNFGLA
jgi:hypothetical protein